MMCPFPEIGLEIITKVYVFVLTYVNQTNKSVITNVFFLLKNTSHENTFNLKFLC